MLDALLTRLACPNGSPLDVPLGGLRITSPHALYRPGGLSTSYLGDEEGASGDVPTSEKLTVDSIMCPWMH